MWSISTLWEFNINYYAYMAACVYINIFVRPSAFLPTSHSYQLMQRWRMIATFQNIHLRCCDQSSTHRSLKNLELSVSSFSCQYYLSSPISPVSVWETFLLNPNTDTLSSIILTPLALTHVADFWTHNVLVLSYLWLPLNSIGFHLFNVRIHVLPVFSLFVGALSRFCQQ